MMKKIYIFALLLFAASVVSAQKNPKDNFNFAPLKNKAAGKVVQHTLSNGIRLILMEDNNYPTIDIQGMIYTGSVFDPAGKEGLAEITGSVMRSGGSEEMFGDILDEKLETIAAGIETDMGSDAGYFSASMLKNDSDFVLVQLRNVIVHPAFPQNKIEIAKDEMRSGIAQRNDNPQSIRNREFPKMVFGDDSPYLKQVEYKSINAITRNDIIDFHKKYYHPENTVISVWGQFKAPEMIDKLENTFKSWKQSGAKKPEYPVLAEKKGTSIEYIEKKDVNQADIIIGHIGGKYSDDDYAAMTVMNKILSFERLFKKLRTDEGLAYNVWGLYGANFNRPSTFSMGIQTRSETAVKAVTMIIKEMDLIMTKEVSAQELNKAKEQIINSFVFEYDSTAKIARRNMIYKFYGYPLDYNETVMSKISSVTAADILKAAKKNLNKNNLKYLIIGNKDKFDKGLESIGKVKTRDIIIPE
jgi:zinc protease